MSLATHYTPVNRGTYDQYGHEGAPREDFTSKPAGGEHPWQVYFGAPNGPVEKDNPYDMYGPSIETVERAFKGRNFYLEAILITFIAWARQYPIRRLMPWTENANFITVEWDIWQFDDALLSSEPSLMIPRLVTSKRSQNKAQLMRQGIGFALDFDFAKEPRGRIAYRNHTIQIVNAVVFTMCLNVMLALLYPAYENLEEIYRQRRFENQSVMRKFMHQYLSDFAGVQKSVGFLSRKKAESDEIMVQRLGRKGNCLVLPNRTLRYASENPHLRSFIYSGKASTPITALKDATEMISEGGDFTIFESNSHPQGTGVPALDPNYGPRAICMSMEMDYAASKNLIPWKTSYMDIWGYSETPNRWIRHNYRTCLPYAGLFNVSVSATGHGGSGPAPEPNYGTLSEIGIGVTKGHDNCASWMSACDVLTPWVNELSANPAKMDSFRANFGAEAKAPKFPSISASETAGSFLEVAPPVHGGGGGGAMATTNPAVLALYAKIREALEAVNAGTPAPFKMFAAHALLVVHDHYQWKLTEAQIDAIRTSLNALLPLAHVAHEAAQRKVLRDYLAATNAFTGLGPVLTRRDTAPYILLSLSEAGLVPCACDDPRALRQNGALLVWNRGTDLSVPATNADEAMEKLLRVVIPASITKDNLTEFKYPFTFTATESAWLADYKESARYVNTAAASIRALAITKLGHGGVVTEALTPDQINAKLSNARLLNALTNSLGGFHDDRTRVVAKFALMKNQLGATKVDPADAEVFIGGEPRIAERSRLGGMARDSMFDEIMSRVNVGSMGYSEDLKAVWDKCVMRSNTYSAVEFEALCLSLDAALKNMAVRGERKVGSTITSNVAQIALSLAINQFYSDPDMLMPANRLGVKVINKLNGMGGVANAKVILATGDNSRTFASTYLHLYDLVIQSRNSLKSRGIPVGTIPSTVFHSSLTDLGTWSRIATGGSLIGGPEHSAHPYGGVPDVANAILRSMPITYHIVQWGMDNDMPPLFNLVLVRQPMYTMGTGIYIIGDGGCGWTFHSRHNFLVSIDTARELILAHYSLWAKAVVTNALAIIHWTSMVCRDYLGGNDHTYLNLLDVADRSDYIQGEYTKDIIVMATRPNESMSERDMFDLTGFIHPDLRGETPSVDEPVPSTAPVYAAWLNLAHGESHSLDDHRIDDQPRQNNNTLCFRDHYWQFTGNERSHGVIGKGYAPVTSTGQWGGDTIAPGCAEWRRMNADFATKHDYNGTGIARSIV